MWCGTCGYGILDNFVVLRGASAKFLLKPNLEVKQGLWCRIVDVASARRPVRWIETQLFVELISKLRVRICGLEYLISSKFCVRK